MATSTHSWHSVGESNWHLQFTPAYRQQIFHNPLTRELTVGYLVQKAHVLGLHVGAIDCGPDHIHLFLQGPRKVSVVEAVQYFKGYSIYMMRKGHSHLFSHLLWGKKFWSGGYFYQTVGTITADTVKRYIAEGQEKYWDNEQKTIFNYSESPMVHAESNAPPLSEAKRSSEARPFRAG